ncbi:hypothetical protein GCM10009535_60220 [Streptomyces thermocarboxydovorans]|uniref:Uncharacterized protein n=1 Tax=Streptomyces thermocarboxydovorans TaxID=59298 RepID=A0ABP3T9L5_9ACTN
MNSGMPNSLPLEEHVIGVSAADAAEVSPQNRYGPVATRGTLRIGRGGVKGSRQDLLVQVLQPAAGVRLGVLHPAEQTCEDLSEGGTLLR